MWSWVLAFRNLGRNKRRSLATGLAIGAGFVGLILISAYLYRAQNALQASTIYLNHKGHLALFKKGSLEEFTYRPSRYLITLEEQNKIAEIFKSVEADIEFTGRYLTGTGLINNQTKSTPFIATAVEPEVYKRILNHPEVHTWTPGWVFAETIKTSDQLANSSTMISITESMGLIIGKNFPFTNYSPEERTVQLIGKSYYGDLNAVDSELGLRHTTGMALAEDTSLYLSLAQLQSLYATDGIQYWAIFLKDKSRISKIKSKLEKAFKDQNLTIDIYPFDHEEWGAYYVGSISFLFVIACFFVILICGAVILSVVNTTTLGIFERHKEIGTLRATGFPPKAIYTLFWKENLILSLIALMLGYLAAEWIASIINAANIKFNPPGTQGDIQFVLITHAPMTFTLAGMVILINFISTMAAVRRTTKTSIVNLLTASGG
jgi:putative ABC transport system permease protein